MQHDETASTPIETETDHAASEALARIRHTARQCSALLWGEREEHDPDADSSRCQLTSMAMMYFLCRIDPDDARAFWFSEHGLAQNRYRPFPKRIKAGRGVFPALFGLGAAAGAAPGEARRGQPGVGSGLRAAEPQRPSAVSRASIG
jgi:hypothetical protein